MKPMHERKPETTEAGMYPTTDVRRREPIRWKAAPTCSGGEACEHACEACGQRVVSGMDRRPWREAAPTSAVPMHIATRVVAIARRESHSTYLTKGAQR